MVAHGRGPSLGRCSIVSSLSASPVSQKCLQAWVLCPTRLPRNDSSQLLTGISSVLEGCACPLTCPLPSSLLESVFCPGSRVTLKNVDQPVSEPTARDLPGGFQTPSCPRVLSAALCPCLLPLILTGPHAQPLSCPSLWLSSAPVLCANLSP